MPHDSLPVIHLRLEQLHTEQCARSPDAPLTRVYECPLYRTAQRRGVLSTSGQSTNFIMCIGLPTGNTEPEHWVCQGTALLLETIAPAAAAEILAIPEIWEKRLFSIVDLSEFQFAGGGRFDAEFIGRDPKLLFGENPFAVDFFALRRLAEARVRGGFSPRKPKEVLLFRYARELGLGDVGKSRYFEIP